MREPGRTAGPSAAPDFLSKTVASVDFMRLYGKAHTRPCPIGWTEKKQQVHYAERSIATALDEQ